MKRGQTGSGDVVGFTGLGQPIDLDCAEGYAENNQPEVPITHIGPREIGQFGMYAAATSPYPADENLGIWSGRPETD